MIRLRSRVALKDAPQFTGVVERDENGLFTIKFDIGGRGWLRAKDLTDITKPTGKEPFMHKGSKAALRVDPTITGTVKAIDHEAGTAEFTEDGTGIRQTRDVAELVEVADLDLPADKSWPPRGMETKST